jgi:tetratricopeptide (TPR) repeat protein
MKYSRVLCTQSFLLPVLLSFSAAAALAQTATLTPQERGDLYMARKMFREAADTYRENAGKSAIMWDKVGIAYQQLGNTTAARKAYERSSKLDKKYADPVNNLGTLYYAEKKYRTAVARYKRAIEISPDTASFLSNLGTAWYSRGRYDLMNECYSKALQLDPEVFEKVGTVGTRMLDRGVQDRARYHFEMARLYAENGKNELALQYLRKALEEGFKEKNKLEQAKEFSAIRETQEFKDLMAREPRVL